MSCGVAARCLAGVAEEARECFVAENRVYPQGSKSGTTRAHSVIYISTWTELPELTQKPFSHAVVLFLTNCNDGSFEAAAQGTPDTSGYKLSVK